MTMTNAIVFAMIFIQALFNAGCGARRVTDDHRFWGGYVVGATYKLTQPVAIIHHQWSRDHDPKFDDYMVPFEPEEIRSLEENRPGHKQAGTLAAGTHVRVERILAYYVHSSFLYWQDLVVPVARVLDGPFSGMEIGVDEISRHMPLESPRADLVRPDPRHIEPANGS